MFFEGFLEMAGVPNFKITQNLMVAFQGIKSFLFAILSAKHFSYRKND